MNAEIIAALGPYLVPGRTYPGSLPAGLAEWYCYTIDGGHSIACRLASDPDAGLLPVPVRTVLRGYRVTAAGVIVDLPYDDELGIVTPPEDDEF